MSSNEIIAGNSKRKLLVGTCWAILIRSHRNVQIGIDVAADLPPDEVKSILQVAPSTNRWLKLIR